MHYGAVSVGSTRVRHPYYSAVFYAGAQCSSIWYQCRFRCCLGALPLYSYTAAGQYTVVAGEGPTARWYRWLGGLADEGNTSLQVLVVGKKSSFLYQMELAKAHLTVVDIGIVENTNSNKRFELSLILCICPFMAARLSARDHLSVTCDRRCRLY